MLLLFKYDTIKHERTKIYYKLIKLYYKLNNLLIFYTILY